MARRAAQTMAGKQTGCLFNVMQLNTATMLPLSLVDAMFEGSLCRTQVVVQLSPAEQEIEE